MALFTIADPHLSFGVCKPMDIFRGWDSYTDKLKENWERLVSPDDTVVLPGDISWAMTLAEAAADFAWLDALPGTKLIGKGNHDYWWSTMNKMETFAREQGFSTIRFLFNNACRCGDIAVCGTRGWFFDAAGNDSEENAKVIRREAGRLKMSAEAALRLGGTPVAFMHYPVAADGNVCGELFAVLKEYGIRRCYFGHIHGDKSGRYADYTVDGVRFSLVSADFLRFCPKKAAPDA